MRGVVAAVLAALAVLYSLVMLLSADRTTTNLGLAASQEKIADSGTRFLETILLHRQKRATDHQSD
jgi:hypothetical protein